MRVVDKIGAASAVFLEGGEQKTRPTEISIAQREGVDRGQMLYKYLINNNKKSRRLAHENMIYRESEPRDFSLSQSGTTLSRRVVDIRSLTLKLPEN